MKFCKFSNAAYTNLQVKDEVIILPRITMEILQISFFSYPRGVITEIRIA